MTSSLSSVKDWMKYLPCLRTPKRAGTGLCEFVLMHCQCDIKLHTKHIDFICLFVPEIGPINLLLAFAFLCALSLGLSSKGPSSFSLT